MKIGIISGFYPRERFNSQVNHRIYADIHGYYHVFNSAPEKDRRLYFRKIETILRYMDLFDWIFWIDDDAYLTDLSIPLTAFLDKFGDKELIICKSPSTKKMFTLISSGNFLLKSSARSKNFLRKVLQTDLETVRRFWREDFGIFTNGDQDCLVYQMLTNPEFGGGFHSVIDHNHFNNRDFEYKSELTEHFLVHFAGNAKEESKRGFCSRLKCNKYIVPDALLEKYTLGIDALT